MKFERRNTPLRWTAILEVAEKKPEKIQASTESEPVPPRYWLSATTNRTTKSHAGRVANLRGFVFLVKKSYRNFSRLLEFLIQRISVNKMYCAFRQKEICPVDSVTFKQLGPDLSRSVDLTVLL